MFVGIPYADHDVRSADCGTDRSSNCGADPGARSDNGSDTNP